MDRVLALHLGSRGFDSHRRHMSERFFRSNRPGYPHPMSSELENSGIRVAVGDCSITERRRWRPPYQTGKTVHVHAKHYKHNGDGRTAPGVCGNGSVPLSHSGNVVTKIGIHTHASCRDCPSYLASAETVRDLLLPAETTFHEKWLPAETVRVILLLVETLRRKLNHTDSFFCRKLFTKHNSLGRKQKIAYSLG